LTLRPPETEFDRGIRCFGYLLTSAMLLMVLLVFVAHMFRGSSPVDTLLFSVALAVGLSPELLPAILSVNLARGAQMMARHGVLVRHLNAIENLGSVDVLCVDKTGTRTEGVVQLEGAYDVAGAPSSDVLDLAAWNAAFETGIASPLDDAILAARTPTAGGARKLAEIPFDFTRKRVTVVFARPEGVHLVTKGRSSGARSLQAIRHWRVAGRGSFGPTRAALRGLEPPGDSRPGNRVAACRRTAGVHPRRRARPDVHGVCDLSGSSQRRRCDQIIDGGKHQSSYQGGEATV
jgi:P-type Mg2+ transporter